MKVILAVSSELSDKLNFKLPYLLASHDRHVDNQLLTCDRHAVALQVCSFAHREIKPELASYDIIMVAAYSRYSLIIPNVCNADSETIEQQYADIMRVSIDQISAATGMGAELGANLHQSCQRKRQIFDWFSYSAPNMFAHCERVRQILRDYYRHNPIGSLDMLSAQQLCKPINTSATSADEVFIPIERLTQEWLIRCGGGDYTLLPASDPNADSGDLSGRTIAKLAHADVLSMDFLRRRQLLA